MTISWTIFITAFIIILLYILVIGLLDAMAISNQEWPIKLVAVIAVTAIYLYITYIYLTIKYPLVMVW